MSAIEKHYSVKEVALLWKVCSDTVRDIFKDVPGVLRIDRPKTRRKRGYTSLRIPESVVHRVHQRLTSKAA